MTLESIKRDLHAGYYIAWTNIYSGDILALFDKYDMTIGFIGETQFHTLQQEGIVEKTYETYEKWVERGEKA